MGRSPVLVTLSVTVLRPAFSVISPPWMNISPAIMGSSSSSHLIGSCTVTSLVPSGNVASTCTSWTISAMPSITCARVTTAAPASISSATLRPSRAPSRMKSVISATASGWLSFTPRSSLRRATIAAMAMSSLSLSRGVRFMSLPSVEPQPRQAAAAQQREQGRKILPQDRAGLRDEPGQRKAVPGRDADLAGKCLLAHRAHQGIIARHDQHARDRDRAVRAGGHRELVRDGAVEAQRIREQQPVVAAHAPAIEHEPALDPLSHPGPAEDHGFRENEPGVGCEVDIDGAGDAGAVEQDRLLRQPGE